MRLRLSYLSPKMEVRESKIHGGGLFTTDNISKGEVVAVKSGHIVDRETLRARVTPRLWPGGNPDQRRFVHRARHRRRARVLDVVSNHSCDPNLGVRGEITCVAMRDIRAGEELTRDWAITDHDDYSVKCKCGARCCRKILTGKDWHRPELQKRSAGYFSSYLADKIARQVMLSG